MTPMEERRAKLNAEAAAYKARKMVMEDVLELTLSRMPEGHVKRCGQILQKTGRLHDLIGVFDSAASKPDTLDEKLSQQVLDYLSCVYVGMVEFCKQMGLEDTHGTP